MECPECRNPVGGDVVYALGVSAGDVLDTHQRTVARGDRSAVRRYQMALDDLDSIELHGMCVGCDDDRRAIDNNRARTFGERAYRLEVCMCCGGNVRAGEPTVAVRAYDSTGSATHDRRICAPCADRIASALGEARQEVA